MRRTSLSPGGPLGLTNPLSGRFDGQGVKIVRKHVPPTLWLFVLLFVACPSAAAGQDRSLTDVLTFLMTTQAVQTADVVRDREAAMATRDTIARSLLLELATLPIASSSSAFTYRFDQRLGTLNRLAQSFGPFIVDRAVTAGAKHVSLGVTYRQAGYRRLDGRDLQDGTLVTTANRFRDEPQAFDIDTLALELAAKTVTLFGSVGIADWLDVGAAVPIVRTDLSGERVNTYRGVSLVQARAMGTATGLADIALRTKARFFGQGLSGMAALMEVRLPTGDPENLSGAGHSGVKAVLIGSIGRGSLDAHVNAAVVRGGVSSETHVSAAVAVAVTPQVTLSLETFVRRVKELGEIDDIVASHPLVSDVDTIRLGSVGGNVTTATLVTGVRWNVAQTWLINANIAVPTTERGLVADVVPTVSLEYSFAR